MTVKLKLPLNEKDVRRLKTGDEVLINGTIYTARDTAHSFLASTVPEKCPVTLEGAVIYHCGPIAIPNGDSWKITAAGPTTSARTEPYIAEIIRKFGVRAFIGKGGLGTDALNAFSEYGCVYLSAVGGCAQILAKAIKQVNAVYFYEEFGSPEAIWELSVSDFPAVVTMDASGNTMHDD